MLFWMLLFFSCEVLFHSCKPLDCIMTGSSVLHYLLGFAQIHVESVMLCNHLTFCCPLLLLPSIFPSIRVFSNESAFRIRWPKSWSFSFNNSPYNEYSGLIFFRIQIDWIQVLHESHLACTNDSSSSGTSMNLRNYLYCCLNKMSFPESLSSTCYNWEP